MYGYMIIAQQCGKKTCLPGRHMPREEDNIKTDLEVI
jgi:hypothetical protein